MASAEFRMPSLGADMTEGTVLEWKLSPGQAFRKGDVLLDVDTDKAAFEVEADYDGVLGDILVEPGTTVPVGTVLARVEGVRADAGPAAGRAAAAFDAAPASSGTSPQTGPVRSTRADPGAGARRVRASPRARERARELGVDLSSIATGSGVAGAIEAADVEAAARSRPAGPAEPRRSQADRQQRLRSVIAAAMSRSKREIPHYYLTHTIDLEPALDWLERVNGSRPIGERLLPNVLMLRAVVLALETVPEVNGYWQDGVLQIQPDIHLGVAISLRGGGVIAPALRHVRHKTLDELMAELADLVRRSRAGRVRQREMTEGTITVTSLGDRGTDVVHGVIFPPQVALIGFGTVALRPWVVGGHVVPRRLVTATLAADHRASDGHRGALFLRQVADRLQEPDSL